MKCVLRVDASDAIGSGHLSRCLALADALRADGARTLFVCREHPGHGGERVRAAGHALHLLAPGTSPPRLGGELAHHEWLGASWQEDAEATAVAIAAHFDGPADWLVVDHYALDARWESRLRAQTRRLLAIDDLADRAHDCEMLLDQNLVAEMDSRYEGRVPEGSLRLLGPRFALLQGEYAEAHAAVAPRAGPTRRVLVFFGGGDAAGLTERFLSALGEDLRNYELDVVMAYGRKPPPERQRLRFHQDLVSLAPLLARADLALGAGGVSNWERLCLGVPALVAAVAANQIPICEELDRLGLIRYLGEEARLDGAALLRELDEESAREHTDWSRRCLQAVDGLGAARVSALLGAGPGTPLRARRAGSEDEARLLEWANDEQARAQAFHPARIGADEHARWFRARLDSEDCRLFIVETGAGLPAGQVRFERRDADWVISYSIDAGLRGRGLGARVLATGLEALRESEPQARVSGLVKHGNVASRRVFEQLGFARGDLGDALEYRRDLRGFAADANR